MELETLVTNTRYEHSRQVSKISAILAERAGYSPKEAVSIGQAALFHDVGKVDIPALILNKPGALTPDEFAVVKTHTELGYNRIMESVKVLMLAAEVCRDHHERNDGSGYAGKTGSDIHPFVKLISVVDIFDALYSQRAYKSRWSISDIRAFFSAHCGTQFDVEVVALLFSSLDIILPLYRPECV